MSSCRILLPRNSWRSESIALQRLLRFKFVPRVRHEIRGKLPRSCFHIFFSLRYQVSVILVEVGSGRKEMATSWFEALLPHARCRLRHGLSRILVNYSACVPREDGCPLTYGYWWATRVSVPPLSDAYRRRRVIRAMQHPLNYTLNYGGAHRTNINQLSSVSPSFSFAPRP